MTGKQSAVMWLGIVLIFTRLFTTSQWSSIWAEILNRKSTRTAKIPGGPAIIGRVPSGLGGALGGGISAGNTPSTSTVRI